MSRTIDERIVQMTFENQEFEARAKQTSNTIGKLTELLKFKGAEAGLEGLQESAERLDFSPIRMATESVGKGFNALEEIAVGVFRRIGDAIGTYVLGGLNKITGAVNSMTFDQIGAGFQKYTDLTGSVQTLVNSTGKSVEEIDQYLKRLMWYSDETSFGFTDMTKALGTMVSSGGDVETLIPMLMGVGNAVAYAGKGASEFSHVIYNLNQSYSKGFLSTQDWRSVELMGADSKVLKEQLMAAAVELGKLNKGAAKLENFGSLMTKQVFDRSVMEKAFGSFAEMTLEAEKLVAEGKFDTASAAIESLSGKYAEFAERAFRSAQEAKSFKEAIEATQDAVSSGWMQTWQAIFGNYEESKALWTGVTETFWELFASGAESRNKVLESWKSIWKDVINPKDINSAEDFINWEENSKYLTQTEALVSALSAAILKIRDDIANIIKTVFPLPTIVDETGEGVLDTLKIGRKIFQVIENIREALNDFANNGDQMGWVIAIHNGFIAVLQVLKTIVEYAKVFKSDFIEPLATRLKPVLEKVVEIFNNIFKAISNTAIAAREDMTPFQKFLEGILKILDPIISLLEKFVGWIAELTGNVQKVSIFDGILNGIANVVEFIGNIVSGAGGALEKFGEIFKDVFKSISDILSDFLEANGADMSKLAEGGFLAYLGFAIATLVKKVKEGEITLGGGKIGQIFGAVSGGIKSFFETVTGAIQDFVKNEKMIRTLQAISSALIMLAAAMLIMSLVPGDKIASNLGALMGAIGEALATMAIMNKMEGGSNLKGAAMLNAIAIAMIEMAVALKIISTIDSEAMGVALEGLGAALLGVLGFISILTKITGEGSEVKIATIGATLQAIGLALIEIAVALKIASSVEPDKLATALIGMGVALVEVMAFMGILSSIKSVDPAKLTAIGIALIPMGIGLIAIARAMHIMSKIDARKLDTALVGLFGALGTIGLIASLIVTIGGGAANFVAIAAGFLIFAVAINAITVALAALSALGMDRINEGLTGLALAMVTIGGLGALLGLVAVPFAAFSATLLLFAAALYAVSKAMLVAVAAFGAFSLVGSDFVGSLVDVMVAGFTAFIALIPSFILGIGQAIVQCAGQLIEIVGNLIHIVLDAFVQNVPYILDSIITIVIEILKGLNDAIGQWAPLIFQLLSTIIQEFLKGITQLIDTLTTGLVQFLIDVINNLATLINDSSGPLGMAIGGLALAIITALIGGLGMAISTLVGGLGDKLAEMFNGFASLLGGGEETEEGEVPEEGSVSNELLNTLVTEEEAEQHGRNIPIALAKGIEDNKKTLLTTVDEIGTEMTDKMDRAEDAREAARNTVQGFIDEITSMLDAIAAAGAAAGEAFMNALRSTLLIASPSRATAEVADYVVAGFINTMKYNTPSIIDSGDSMGNNFMSALAESIQITDDLLNTDLTPVISPVLDLSDVQSGSGAISRMLSDGASYNAALAVSQSQMALAGANQNGSLLSSGNTININFSVDQAGGNITDEDISRWSRLIANEVDIHLGRKLRG